MPKFLVLNGPNLNLLGTREPELYGATTLAEIETACRALAKDLSCELDWRQSNTEGELIGWLHEARVGVDGIVFNAASLTHSSIGIGDAVAGIDVPVIEVHLTNVHAREEFRHKSFMAAHCLGQITGLGPVGYELAIRALAARLPNV